MANKTLTSKWANKNFIKSLDPLNVPYRPVDIDGIKVRVKDMNKFERSMYRKWLIAHRAGIL